MKVNPAVRVMPVSNTTGGRIPMTEPLPKDAPMSGPDIDLSDLGDGPSQDVHPEGAKKHYIDADDLRKKDKENDLLGKAGKDSGESSDAIDSLDGKSAGDEEADKPSDSLEVEPEKVEDEEEKPEGEAKLAEDKKLPKPDKKGRDYKQFPSSEFADIARHLPNDLYQKFLTQAKEWHQAGEENKQLKETLAKSPSIAYEHENGYLLDPNWTKIGDAFNAYQFEANHWDTQLDKIQNGESWQDFRGFDKEGNPQFVTIPAPADGIVNQKYLRLVERAHLKAEQEMRRTQDAAAGIVQGHKGRMQEAKDRVSALKTKIFPNLSDTSKFSDEDKKYYSTALELFPLQYRNQVGSELACLSYVTMMRWAKSAKKLAEENKRLKAAVGGRKLSGNVDLPVTDKSDKENGSVINLGELKD